MRQPLSTCTSPLLKLPKFDTEIDCHGTIRPFQSRRAPKMLRRRVWKRISSPLDSWALVGDAALTLSGGGTWQLVRIVILVRTDPRWRCTHLVGFKGICQLPEDPVRDHPFLTHRGTHQVVGNDRAQLQRFAYLVNENDHSRLQTDPFPR